MTNTHKATVWTIDTLIDYIYGPEVPEKQYNRYDIPVNTINNNRSYQLLITKGMGPSGSPITKTGYTGQFYQVDRYGRVVEQVIAIAFGKTIRETIASLLQQAADKNILRYVACDHQPPMPTMDDIRAEEYDKAVAKEMDNRDPWGYCY